MDIVSIEKQSIRHLFFIKSMLKGMKISIREKGGIQNCEESTKKLLIKLENRLKDLTQNKEQSELKF